MLLISDNKIPKLKIFVNFNKIYNLVETKIRIIE